MKSADTQTTQTSSDLKPVVIAGGGLVGLSLALMLAKSGIASTLIEARAFSLPDPDDQNYLGLDSRNTALSRRSVEIYRELGLWEVLGSHAQPIDQVQISEIGGFGKARLLAAEEQVESFGQVIENRWLGVQLLSLAQSEPLIELLGGVKITAIDQEPGQVILSLDSGGNQEQMKTQLLVAADGQGSFCRQALGIRAQTKDYAQTAVVGVVETDQNHQSIAYERFGPQGPLALLPLKGDLRRSVVWIAKKGEESALVGADNDGHFMQVLQQAFGQRAGRFTRCGPRGSYPLVQVIADRQVSGRAVLMGNAAHTLHPVAGQGFNLCLRDAMVFTRMLNEFLNNHQLVDTAALSQMLASYERARAKDQARVTKFCDSVVAGFTHKSSVVKFTRNLGLLAFDRVPGIKPLVANFAMGLKS